MKSIKSFTNKDLQEVLKEQQDCLDCLNKQQVETQHIVDKLQDESKKREEFENQAFWVSSVILVFALLVFIVKLIF